MPNHRWTAADIPDLTGRTIIVTGGNSGIGYEAAVEFARHRATVILACRSADKAQAAVRAITQTAPDAHVDAMELNLASLASVRAFAEKYRAKHSSLDVLCNNAGVMAIPYAQTADGFEMQFGTNHLGHFALTGLLMETMLATPDSRVVTVSSGAHRIGSIRFDDLNWQQGYRKWLAYGQSKLANLLFTFELQRRLDVAGAKTRAVACHPGYAATNLQFAGPRAEGSSAKESIMRVANRLFSQSAAMGALPTLYAAVSPDVRGGDYIGPDGFQEMWGYPTRVPCSSAARDMKAAARLWEVSENLTGVKYAAIPG